MSAYEHFLKWSMFCNSFRFGFQPRSLRSNKKSCLWEAADTLLVVCKICAHILKLSCFTIRTCEVMQKEVQREVRKVRNVPILTENGRKDGRISFLK